MIAQYEAADREAVLDAPALYALEQGHKHLPEMQMGGRSVNNTGVRILHQPNRLYSRSVRQAQKNQIRRVHKLLPGDFSAF